VYILNKGAEIVRRDKKDEKCSGREADQPTRHSRVWK